MLHVFFLNTVFFFGLRGKAKYQSCKVSNSDKSPTTSQVKRYEEVVLLHLKNGFLVSVFSRKQKINFPKYDET